MMYSVFFQLRSTFHSGRWASIFNCGKKRLSVARLFATDTLRDTTDVKNNGLGRHVGRRVHVSTGIFDFRTRYDNNSACAARHCRIIASYDRSVSGRLIDSIAVAVRAAVCRHDYYCYRCCCYYHYCCIGPTESKSRYTLRPQCTCAYAYIYIWIHVRERV